MKKYFFILFLVCWFSKLSAQSSIWNFVSGYSIINQDTMFSKKIDGNFAWSLEVKADTLSDTTSFSIYHSNDGQRFSMYDSKTISKPAMDYEVIDGDTSYFYMFKDEYFAAEYIGLRVRCDSGTTGAVRARLVLKK